MSNEDFLLIVVGKGGDWEVDMVDDYFEMFFYYFCVCFFMVDGDLCWMNFVIGCCCGEILGNGIVQE